MKHFWNDNDPGAVAWLRQLAHLFPVRANVCDKSILDITAQDMDGYAQHHFFCGIAGWPVALDMAGLGRMEGVMTGSAPCQPFSIAGTQRGNLDERHLAPVWLAIIKATKPRILFGEQVDAAIRHGWLDDLFDALEECGYACGAAVLPACSVGAPHIRKRIIFGAVRIDRIAEVADEWRGLRAQRLADADDQQRQPVSDEQSPRVFGAVARAPECRNRSGEYRASMGGLAYAARSGRGQARCDASRHREAYEGPPGNRHGNGGADDVQRRVVGTSRASAPHGGWHDTDWLFCRDGKWRPAQSSVQRVAYGLPGSLVPGGDTGDLRDAESQSGGPTQSPAETREDDRRGFVSASYPLAIDQEARVMRLRGYGNAIVPQVAAVFVEEFMNSIGDLADGLG